MTKFFPTFVPSPLRGAPISTALLAINGVIFFANQFGALPWTVSFPGIFSSGTVLAHFSHFSFLHLAMNAYGIFLFSPILEKMFGRARYIFFLLFLWIFLSVAMPFFQTAPTLGFSGMMLGMMSALALILFFKTQKNATHPLRQFAKSLAVLLVINLALPFFLPQISFAGHAVGAVGGLIFVPIFFLKKS
ncbi:rhomboid family intramembrane serine protease [bacterium]|jgi:membrane associated rhomboid family serine protease|nr:rhomboid family intramembrane serine protease [bacterium]MBT6831438.1 rhomboid family intramembrane serine protease [bacterium]MBT6996344.1 rhomboid family intramembrane serine protease [bacterium]MBT7772411.1 rhomboid family intramembrane serine protease [bacterium]